ncbi:hypothetical protein C8R46DRAFT_1228222 [Mycena filopes]|nr:hypothetical protein C8R46DRAFT_1228222 [Mycena filopes]
MRGATLYEYKDSRAAAQTFNPYEHTRAGADFPQCAALPFPSIKTHGPPRRRYPYEHIRARAVFSSVHGVVLPYTSIETRGALRKYHKCAEASLPTCGAALREFKKLMAAELTLSLNAPGPSSSTHRTVARATHYPSKNSPAASGAITTLTRPHTIYLRATPESPRSPGQSR